MERSSSRITVAAALAALACDAVATQRYSPQWSLTLEDAPGQFDSTRISRISAVTDTVGVALSRSAASLTPQGMRRWRLNADDNCPAQSQGFIDSVESLPNGEAWVLRRCPPATSTSPYRHELLRLDAQGNVLVSTELAGTAAQTWYARLLPEPGGVVVAIPLSNGLRWLRIGMDGTVIDDALTGLAGPAQTTITNIRLWPNGSASVATRQYTNCGISPPNACPIPASTLLRLNVDGTERWRVEAGATPPFIGFNDDGSSLIVESLGYEPLRLRQVSATGVPGNAFAAADGERLYVGGAAGPVQGRYLAFSEAGHVLLDGSGTVIARRPSAGTAGSFPLASGNLGFVTGSWNSDAALVSADDLSVVAEFDVDGIDNTSWDDAQWKSLDDGSLYSATLKPGDYGVPNRARISRYAVPGTPAADLIFIDRFE
jgi:hypothetical protein